MDDRPEEINSREIPGHWESDSIIGEKHQSALNVIVERKTRFVMIDLLQSYDAKSVRKSIEKRFKKMSLTLIKSITCNQGKEMSQHKLLAKRMKVKVYFCHPHSPWEKGTCENTNFLIRDMFNGVTDFRLVTQAKISRVAMLLNERPRQILEFRTSKEKIKELCNESWSRSDDNAVAAFLQFVFDAVRDPMKKSLVSSGDITPIIHVSSVLRLRVTSFLLYLSSRTPLSTASFVSVDTWAFRATSFIVAECLSIRKQPPIPPCKRLHGAR